MDASSMTIAVRGVLRQDFSMTQTESAPFPEKGRRVVFYLLFDERGEVDEYITYKLERLRPFAQKIIVISNGPLADSGRAVLEGVADDIWERENVGLDVGGYRFALNRFGHEQLADFDELILMNYTWFGPIGSFEPVFERMNAEKLDYWGMTDHGAVAPHPITGDGIMPTHIQSHWIAVRRSMFTSDEWKSYWTEMPEITSYADSILHHESRFTGHFDALGFRYVVAFPNSDYPDTEHPAIERAQTLIDAGCPVLKRRAFFQDPLYADREGIIGRWLIDAAESAGYPVSLMLSNLARHVAPRVLNTNASMFEILPERAVDYDQTAPLRIVATAHIFYEDMTDELLDRLATLPSAYDLVVTTSDEAKAKAIRTIIDERADPAISKYEVRVLPSNRGRDISAFYVGCGDILRDGDYDLVVKIHSKKTPQQGAAVGALFKRQQIDNLLNSPGYTANLVGLFQKEPGLGLVFPPMVHIGFPTLGGAWFTNKELAKRLCADRGIQVPLDDLSPLAPFGSMFIARPEALRLLVTEGAEGTSYDDYSPEGEYADGTLAHTIERLPAYAAGELGFHTRTVANAEYAAISHTFLEYKLDQLSETVQGDAVDEIHTLRKRQFMERQIDSGRLGPLKFYLGRYHPTLLGVMAKMYHVVRPSRAPKAAEDAD